MPRRPTVSVGVPARTLPASPTTTTSARNSSGSSAGYAGSAPLPISSWPSISSLMPTGGRPSWARSAPTCASTFDLESAVPRPKRAPLRSLGSKGGVSQRLSSPGPTTS